MLMFGLSLTSPVFTRKGTGGSGGVDLIFDENGSQIVDESYRSILGESFDPLYFSSRLQYWGDVTPGYLFQDSAGTILATVEDESVGRITDRSGNSHHALQSTSNKRPTLKKMGRKYYIKHNRSTQDLAISSLDSGTYYSGISTFSGTFIEQFIKTSTGSHTLNQADIFSRIFVKDSLSTNERLELLRWLSDKCPETIGNTDIFRVWSNTNSVSLSIVESSNSGATWLLGDGQTAAGISCVKTITAPQSVILRATSPDKITQVVWSSKSLYGQLDLSKLVNVTVLNFSANELTGPLNLVNNVALTSLYAASNYLTGTVSFITNTLLTIIQLSSNQFSGNLDFSTNINLTNVDLSSNLFSTFSGTVSVTLGDVNLSSNLFTQAMVDAILAAFVTTGRNFGTRVLNLGGTGNAAPSVAGLASKATLQTRGWTVTTN